MSFEFSGQDESSNPLSSYSCKIDNQCFEDCTGTQDYNGLPDGQHTFTVKGADSRGLQDRRSYSWYVDSIPPTVEFTQKPSSPLDNPVSTFTFQGHDNRSVADFECRSDSDDEDEFASCDDPTNISSGSLTSDLGFSDGQHTMDVRAKDKAGNLSDDVRHSWTVATIPQVTVGPNNFTPIVIGGKNYSNHTNAFKFNIAATDAGANLSSGHTCFLSIRSGIGTSSANCSNAVFSFLNGINHEGEFSLRVRHTDLASNSGEATYAWIIDRTVNAPTISQGGVSGSIYGRDFNRRFDFEAGTDVSGIAKIECKIDSGSYETCVTGASGSKSYTEASGTYIIYARSHDGTGNISSESQIKWVIDNASPSITDRSKRSRPAGGWLMCFNVNDGDEGSGVVRVRVQLSPTDSSLTSLPQNPAPDFDYASTRLCKVYTNAEIDNATDFVIEVTDRVGWTVTESYGSIYTPATGWDD